MRACRLSTGEFALFQYIIPLQKIHSVPRADVDTPNIHLGIVSQLKSLASLGTKTHQKKRQELKKIRTKTLCKERIKFKIVLRSKKEVQAGLVCLHPPNVIFREESVLSPINPPQQVRSV